MNIISQLQDKIKENFNCELIEIIDESHKHKGHKGFKAGQVTHIKIRIKSPELQNIHKIQAHRQVYKCIDEYMNNPIHAVAIEIVKETN